MHKIKNASDFNQGAGTPSTKLIDDLIETLNSNDLNYCHWKSNFSLGQSLTGEIDLDLLVYRRTLPATFSLLLNLGFKMATVRQGIQDPGIYHFYGFDSHTGQLIHVHLFSHVLTGESFIKSHLLPLKTMLLDNTQRTLNIKTPSKHAELVLFVLRNFIKYGSLLDFIYLVKSKNELNDEFNWLESGSDLSKSVQLLKQYCPVIEEKLFLKCIDILQTQGSLLKRILTARQVRKRLQVYSRFTRLNRAVIYTQLLGRYFWKRIGKNQKNKRLLSGGSIITFVGPEATGKSTLVSECERWLGDIFTAKSIHAGKPPSSFLTYPLNVIIPLLRKLVPGFRTSRVEKHVQEKGEDLNISSKRQESTSLLYALRLVALAWDRRNLLIKAKRSSVNGELVICDRYPSGTVGAMDSPRLREDPNHTGFRYSIYNYLARMETHFYRQIPPPDIVLQLHVSVEIAKQRNKDRIKKGKESDEYLESRHLQNKGWQISGEKCICDINTDLPLDETILQVKKSIWEEL